jgi:hypothetical protein
MAEIKNFSQLEKIMMEDQKRVVTENYVEEGLKGKELKQAVEYSMDTFSRDVILGDGLWVGCNLSFTKEELLRRCDKSMHKEIIENMER